MADRKIQFNCYREDGTSQFVFFGDELKNIQIEQKADPICSSIPISTASFTIVSPKYYYTKGQRFNIQKGNSLMVDSLGGFNVYVKTAKKIEKNTWQIFAEDAVSFLQEKMFLGGVYSGEKTQKALMGEILSTALKKTDFEIVGDFSEPVYGWIPYCTCREALKQICFASQAVVDTSYGGKLRVVKIETPQNIRSFSLGDLKKVEDISDGNDSKSVSLYWHAFEKNVDAPREEIAKISIFDSKTSTIFFDKPYFDLDVGYAGEILESGDNYAIVERTGAVTLTGIPYSHGTGRLQKTPTYGEISGESIIQNATLVTESAAQSILDSCYNYINAKRLSAEVIETPSKLYTRYGEAKYGSGYKYGWDYLAFKPVRQLNIYSVPVYGENINGIVEKQTFKLTAGALVKNCEIAEYN